MSEEEKQREKQENESQEQLIPWATFLEEYPVGSRQKVSGYHGQVRGLHETYDEKTTPPLRLYCRECKGVRNFDGEWTIRNCVSSALEDDFLVYTCRDCEKESKHYCLQAVALTNGNGVVVKIGEYPELSIDIPSGLRKLFGEDYGYFIKGLQCEKRGLGVGAYVYYRRVVENQKGRLLEEILKVAQKVGAQPDKIEAIKKAINETQFAKAVDMVKGMLPESLLVDGHNPLKLIHKALSIAIHNESDEKCLELAHNIRMVLTDLSERMKSVLSEQRELKDAVSSLMKFNQERT